MRSICAYPIHKLPDLSSSTALSVETFTIDVGRCERLDEFDKNLWNTLEEIKLLLRKLKRLLTDRWGDWGSSAMPRGETQETSSQFGAETSGWVLLLADTRRRWRKLLTNLRTRLIPDRRAIETYIFTKELRNCDVYFCASSWNWEIIDFSSD